MRFSITGHMKSTLARGAAVLVVGGIAAGCSSGAASLDDGLVTNSTSSSQPVKVAQADQPYPGDAQTTRRTLPNYIKILRPKVAVGGNPAPATAGQALPAPSTAGNSSATAARQGVRSEPLPAPQAAQNPNAASTQRTTAMQSAPASQQQSQQVATLPAAPKAPEPARNSAEASPSPAAGGAYKVASGDTLYGISRKTGVSVDDIKRANGLSDGLIKVGQTLTIPTAGSVVTASAPAETKTADPVTTGSASASASTSGSQGDKPKVSTYTPPAKEETAEKAASESQEMAALTPDATGVDTLRWPVNGRVVSAFGSGGGKNNDGIDIAVPEGTPVKAAENGVVIYSGDGLKGFGNTVLVRHEDGLVTVYGHASQIKVKRGDKVKRGQEIALSGMSGDADRPKLHFEVRNGTSPVDPMSYLQ